jgi:hypothetical protein
MCLYLRLFIACRVLWVDQNRIYTPYMTVYLVITLLTTPYNIVLANPTRAPFRRKRGVELLRLWLVQARLKGRVNRTILSAVHTTHTHVHTSVSKMVSRASRSPMLLTCDQLPSPPNSDLLCPPCKPPSSASTV